MTDAMTTTSHETEDLTVLPHCAKAEYFIPSENKRRFLNRMELLGRKAEKLGLTKPNVTFLREEVKAVVDERIIREYQSSGLVAFDETPKVCKKFAVYAVEDLAVKIPGWTFRAVIESTPAGNVVRSAPSGGVDASWQTKKPSCEHCNQPRNRKLHFVFQNESGEEKCVGSNCLKDFSGHKSPAAIAAYFELVRETFAAGERSSRGGEHFFDIKTVLAVSASIIRIDGFVSRKMATESLKGIQTTSSKLYRYLMDRPSLKEDRTELEEFRAAYKPLERDFEKAEIVYEWLLDLETLEERSDYQNNLLIFAKLGEVSPKEFGYVASSVFVALKELGQLEPRDKEPRENIWRGRVGEKIETTLKLVRKMKFGEDYSPYYVLLFRDERGNSLKWVTSKGCFEEDKFYVVRGTVKALETWKDQRQTVITRCKAEEVPTE